jgi:hypothetical protein
VKFDLETLEGIVALEVGIPGLPHIPISVSRMEEDPEI